MKIKFVVVGKTVEKYLIDSCSEYEKRIKSTSISNLLF